MKMTKSIGDLSPCEFENLVFDLVQSIGLKNTVWRTPGRDGGRDIQGEWFIEDLSGHTALQVWHIECKQHKTSISWPTVWEKISYAESNAADVLLFAVTSSLSPQAVDEVNKWNAQRRKLSIRFWNGSDIEKKLIQFPLLSIKFGLRKDPMLAIGSALLPIVTILLKYSISAHSAEVFGRDATHSKDVIYSISDLISARLTDLERQSNFSITPFREYTDGFEWLRNANIAERLHLDRYAFRTTACCLRNFSKENIECYTENDTSLYFKLTNELPDCVYGELYQISMLSNYEISKENNTISIKGRKNEQEH